MGSEPTDLIFCPRVDKFNLWSNRHLGELQKIRIGHDNSGAGPAWFLDKVKTPRNNSEEF